VGCGKVKKRFLLKPVKMNTERLKNTPVRLERNDQLKLSVRALVERLFFF